MARALVVAAAIAAVAALPCEAAQWKQVRKAAEGELWLDTASVKRKNGEVYFEYRIDYPKPQQEVGSKTMYQSTVTKAMVRCSERRISIGPTQAFEGKGARGKMLGTHAPLPDEARFQPVEPRSSDETLWQQVCSIAKLTPK